MWPYGSFHAVKCHKCPARIDPRFNEYSPESKPNVMTTSSGPTDRHSFIASSLPPKEMYPKPYGLSCEIAFAPFTDHTVGAFSSVESSVVSDVMPGHRAASAPA